MKTLVGDAIYPNGINTNYSYDNLNRLTRLKADLGATPVTDFQYLYDAAGNRTRKQQLDYTEDYFYDPLYRLTGVERSAGLTGINHYGYDAVGNRTTNQINDSVLTSAFNEKNQLTSSAGGGTLKVRGTLNEPGTAKVNGSPARMLAGNVFEATIQATTGTNTFAVEATDQSGNVTNKNYQVSVSATGATYTYDPNGNLTQKVEGADTWAYTWDADNRLKKVEKNTVEQARFAYDPMGRRVEKVAAGVTTNWAYDTQDILRLVRGGSTVKYIQGPWVDEHLGTDDGSTVGHLHADALGSVMKITNAAGAETLVRRYDPWGNLELEAATDGYAYTGREWDPEAGLYYYRARYYDAKLGRFLSEDPLPLEDREVRELNAYSYVRNSPTSRVDPLGLESGDIWRDWMDPDEIRRRRSDQSTRWSPWAQSRWRCTVRCREVTIPLLVPLTGFTWGQLMHRIDPETFTWAKPIGNACTTFNAAATVTCAVQCGYDPSTIPGSGPSE